MNKVEPSNNELVGDEITSAIFLISNIIRQNQNGNTWEISREGEKDGLFNVKNGYFKILSEGRFSDIQKNLQNFASSKGINSLKILSSTIELVGEGDKVTLTLKTTDPLLDIMQELGQILTKYKNEIFNYSQQINDLKDLAVKGLGDFSIKAGLDISHLPLNEVRVDKTEFSGLEDLVQFEVDFAASGTQVIYPNPLEMSEAHIKHITGNKQRNPFAISETVISNEDQLLLQYRYYYYIYLFHEIFHCFQTLDKQSDPNNGWSHEHDASFISSILMIYSSKLGTKEAADYFKPGRIEEAMLFLADEGLATHYTLLREKSAYIEGYIKWRDSFGYEKPVPQDSFSFEDNRVLDYFKIRVTIEAFVEFYNLSLSNNQEKFLSLAVDNCFKYNKKDTFPEKQSIISSASYFSS